VPVHRRDILPMAALLIWAMGPWHLVRATDRPSFIVLTASACSWEEATNWKEGGERDALVRLRREGAGLRRFHGNPVAAPGHAESAHWAQFSAQRRLRG